MFKCGICLKSPGQNLCGKCIITACKKCSISKRSNTLCVMCYTSCNNFVKCKNYIHCFACDNVILLTNYNHEKGVCIRCQNYDAIEHRETLSHYKAKPIIESQVAPEIAQIIFDYYYIPRRYFRFEL